MEVIQAYDAILQPKDISPKDTKNPNESPIPVPPSSSPVRSTTPDYLFDESIFTKLDNLLWIVSRPLGSKPVLEDFKESDALVISLYLIISQYQLCVSRLSILYPKIPPKRTSTSASLVMTQAAIRQLVADSIAAALEAQAANMANANNTNRNSGTSRTKVARKGSNDLKRKFVDRRNTTTNNDNNYSNNRNNNYQDNHNNHNRNNDYHQQQNRRKDKKYHGNLPLCTRCTLHHTGICTIGCQTCNKVGHRTRNCRSKGPTTGKPVEIMDREVKQLRQKRIPIVKVRRNSEFTWEREDQMRAKYPHLFPNTTQSSN
nr:putative reverse transcriptase domain-containing protein [Tanacetum cinerariifolium]